MLNESANQRAGLKMNLQLFADEEDIMLPDDYEAPPAEEIPADEIVEAPPVADTNPPVEPVTEPQKLKIKFNHEEKEIPLEEAAILAQKGLNYEKAVERAKQEARDAYIAEQNITYNGKPITTEAEYKQAQAEQDLIEKYKDRDLPDELIDEIMENRRDREKRKADDVLREEQEKRDAQIAEFAETFPSVDIATIKQETWDKVAQGVPLKYAYMEQERAELHTKVKVLEQNTKNQQRAPVTGVTTHGAGNVASDPFLEGFDSVK